jgi:PIN domain nuclease of toxin-antitoxin system
MKLLLDTHIFLWFIVGDLKLGSKARLLIEDAANEKFVSAASLWEIAVKHSLGKLNLSDDFDALFPKQLEINGFEMLPIKTTHLSKLISLPFYHRDPFDRLIAAQAISENMQIVSVDEIFDSYKIIRHY